MHRVFISYHRRDQEYKDNLVKFGDQYGIFVDRSVDTGDISDELSDERIRETIRDTYLSPARSRPCQRFTGRLTATGA